MERRGWTAVEYVDRGVSGAKDRRPALDELLKAARRRRFDVLVCWRLDRLGRNLRHLILLLDELQALGVAFVTLGEGIDTTTPAGRLQLHILVRDSGVRAGADSGEGGRGPRSGEGARPEARTTGAGDSCRADCCRQGSARPRSGSTPRDSPHDPPTGAGPNTPRIDPLISSENGSLWRAAGVARIQLILGLGRNPTARCFLADPVKSRVESQG